MATLGRSMLCIMSVSRAAGLLMKPLRAPNYAEVKRFFYLMPYGGLVDPWRVCMCVCLTLSAVSHLSKATDLSALS